MFTSHPDGISIFSGNFSLRAGLFRIANSSVFFSVNCCNTTVHCGRYSVRRSTFRSVSSSILNHDLTAGKIFKIGLVVFEVNSHFRCNLERIRANTLLLPSKSFHSNHSKTVRVVYVPVPHPLKRVRKTGPLCRTCQALPFESKRFLLSDSSLVPVTTYSFQFDRSILANGFSSINPKALCTSAIISMRCLNRSLSSDGQRCAYNPLFQPCKVGFQRFLSIRLYLHSQGDTPFPCLLQERKVYSTLDCSSFLLPLPKLVFQNDGSHF